MKVLIMNDNLICGGAEVYTLNLKDILSDYNVKLLCFDSDFKDKIKNVKKPENIENIKPRSKYLNKVLFNPILYFKIRKIIKNFNPDIIVLNNTFLSAITQIKATKGYKTYKIVHDYGIVCPKSTCIKEDLEICTGYKDNCCIKECKYHGSKLLLQIKLLLMKRIERINNKYINKFISPSEGLYSYLRLYNYNAICINNPINFKNIKRNKNQKKYIYIGRINKEKGIIRFAEIFAKFAKDKDVVLDIIGEAKSKEDSESIKKLLNNNPKIKLHGFIPHDEVAEQLSIAKFSVVPSIWLDNYPTTILESMISKTLVLASDRGGAKEMLDGNRGILFDIMNENDILEKLEESYNMKQEEYDIIVNRAYDYVINNNTMEVYKQRFIKNIIGDDNI